MEDVDKGLIGCLLAKDMSRIGRDYLQVGFYTEIQLPQKGVRFIAVSNGVDSSIEGSREFAPFLNIMNEWYLRDTSRKIRTTLREKGKSGRHISSVAIYGYKKDPEDASHWLIDEEAAAVVRRIYRLSIEGYGPKQIADILYQEKVERPSWYLEHHGLGTYRNNCDMSDPYNWRECTVASILSKPEYTGKTVNFRTYSNSYKDRTRRVNDEANWAVFENTQDPIIDQETWNLVQKLRKTRRRSDNGAPNPLTGLVFCADCGARMINHRSQSHMKIDRQGNEAGMTNDYDYYSCSGHRNGKEERVDRCSMHFIRSEVIRELVLEVIRYASQSAIEDEDAFRQRILDAHNARRDDEIADISRKLEADQNRFDELDRLIEHLYEASVSGKISDRRFRMLCEKYEKEQAELEPVIAEEEARLLEVEASEENADRFINLAKRYTDFSELTTPMLNEFVDRITIHEAEKIDGERQQTIEIYLKFIGRVEIPEPELSEEEQKEQERLRKQRARSREKARRYRERQKQKKLAEVNAGKGA